MSSQPADPYKAKNEEDPSLQEKVKDLAAFVDKCKFCMMTTKSPDGVLASRCMALAAKTNNDVDFIFHANIESGKTDDIKNSPDVNLGFLNSAGEWASVSGKAEILTDRNTVREYYSPALKVWLGDLQDGTHDGGPEDPRIAVIKITSDTTAYSISKKGIVGTAIEAVRAVTQGEPPAINKLVHLSAKELQEVRLNVVEGVKT